MSDLIQWPATLIVLIIGAVAVIAVFLWRRRRPRRARFRAESERWAAARFPPEFCAVAASVAAILRHDLGAGFEELERHTKLGDLGIDEEDSDLFIRVGKETLGIDISRSDWLSLKTIDDVVSFIQVQRDKK